MTQSDLARRIGISAPYLNLIEANRRALPASLLGPVAAALGIEPADLDGGAERRLVQALEELAVDPAIATVAGAPAGAEDLVARHNGWAHFILRLFQAYQDQRQAVVALADRLNRDPFLGESVHRLLTDAASLSSAAEILARDDLSNEERRRFRSIAVGDAAKLSDAARALLSYFDKTETRVGSATPMEHVDAFIYVENNHFSELELLAGQGRPEISRQAPPDIASDYLSAGDMAPQTRRFALLRQYARSVWQAPVDALVANHAALPTQEAREFARAALFNYLAGALLMPYDRFLDAAERNRYDIDELCRQFDVSYEQAAHRLATLRRPGAEGVRFAFMRSDMSGFVTKRLPLPGLPLPRYATACPLWIVYGALQTPGISVRQLGELPSGDQYLFFARAIDKMPPRIGYPRKLQSVMLACAANDAGRVVYADGLDKAKAVVPVGTVCRLCRRENCGYRQEEPLLGAPSVSDKRSMVPSADSK